MINTIIALLMVIAGPSALESDQEGVVYSRQPTFRIPLDLTPQEREGLSAIRLFVSEDKGRTWVRYNDGEPKMEIITFRASKDGEYWFTVALVGQDGKQVPDDVRTVEPGLKVVVDATKPGLAVKAIRNRSGRNGIRWLVDDPYVIESSFRLAVWDDVKGSWMPYDIRHPEEKMVWFADEEKFTKLQASILDRAGNERVIEMEVQGDQFSKRELNEFALGPLPTGNVVPVSANVPEATANMVQPAAEMPAPTDVDVTLCSSHQVVVNYVVEHGSGGTAELWASRDQGKNWTLASIDTDGVSPVEAKLEGEGVWGLRILVRESNQTTTGPAPSTTPEMFVNVDTVAPDVKLEPVVVRDRQVIVRWVAADNNLEKQPIDILMSPSVNGPWKPVAVGLGNTGEFNWTPELTEMGGRVFMRVEARDRARHVGFAQTSEPVHLPARERANLFEGPAAR